MSPGGPRAARPPCGPAKPPSRPAYPPCRPILRKNLSSVPDNMNNKVNPPKKVLVSQKIPKNFMRPQTASSMSDVPNVPPIRALRRSTLSVRSERQGNLKPDFSRLYVDHCGDGPCQGLVQPSIKSNSTEVMRIKAESSGVSLKQASGSAVVTAEASSSTSAADPGPCSERHRARPDAPRHRPCTCRGAHHKKGLTTEKSCETQMSEDEEILIQELKNFREENYFETHSCRTQPATSLENHKCTYSFYLNERLFVKPVRTDHLNRVRCDECALPLHLGEKLPAAGARRGTIQAKVRLGGEGPCRDVTVVTPVTEALVVRQWRRAPGQDEALRDPVYLGVLELGGPGGLGGVGGRRRLQPPADSLALRYQRGYRHLQHPCTHTLHIKGVPDEDAIVV